MDINVTGTWNTVMAGADKIIEGGRGGSIILISSAAGMKLQPFMVHYTTSKHAVAGMARAFAAELGKHAIRVNSVHPGPVNTPMGSGDMVAAMGKAVETNPQLSNMLTPFLPKWAAEPEEVADAVCWLARSSPDRGQIGNSVRGLAFVVRMRSFSEAERQEFLAAKHIAVLSVAADGRPPASVPIWYDYTPGGNIRINTGSSSRKARLIERRE